MLYKSPYPHHASRNGETCKIVKKTVYCEEYRPMYVVKFGDGEKEFARPEELYDSQGRYFIMSFAPSHYDWLNENFVQFGENLKNAGLLPHDEPTYLQGLITAHGDKCYTYKDVWEEAGVPFEYGVAAYLMARTRTYKDEVYEGVGAKVDVCQWVIDRYNLFYNHFPPLDNV